MLFSNLLLGYLNRSGKTVSGRGERNWGGCQDLLLRFTDRQERSRGIP
jgi:hypothetical protein